MYPWQKVSSRKKYFRQEESSRKKLPRARRVLAQENSSKKSLRPRKSPRTRKVLAQEETSGKRRAFKKRRMLNTNHVMGSSRHFTKQTSVRMDKGNESDETERRATDKMFGRGSYLLLKRTNLY